MKGGWKNVSHSPRGRGLWPKWAEVGPDRAELPPAQEWAEVGRTRPSSGTVRARFLDEVCRNMPRAREDLRIPSAMCDWLAGPSASLPGVTCSGRLLCSSPSSARQPLPLLHGGQDHRGGRWHQRQCCLACRDAVSLQDCSAPVSPPHPLPSCVADNVLCSGALRAPFTDISGATSYIRWFTMMIIGCSTTACRTAAAQLAGC